MPGRDAIEILDMHGLGAGAHAFVSTRHGGVSRGAYASLNLAYHVGDDPESVGRNRDRLAAAVGIPRDKWVIAAQPHGTSAAVVGDGDAGRGSVPGAAAVPGVDALVTSGRGLCLAVLVADCVPVLLHDPARGAIGIAHAGWRGTVGHVARASVALMADALDCTPESIYAVLGPAIGPADYEVDDDVARAVRSAFPGECTDLLVRTAKGRWLLDLPAANAADLQAAGVPSRQIASIPASTARETHRFYSHRAEGPTGRIAAAVVLQPDARPKAQR